MDNRRLLLAALLSLGVLLLWSTFIAPPPPPVERTPVVVGEGAPATQTETAPAPVRPAETASEPASVFERVEASLEERVVIESGNARLEFTNRGAQLLSFELARPDGAEPVELVRRRDPGQPYPFGLLGPQRASPLNEALFVVERSRENGDERVVFRYSGDRGSATKTFHIPAVNAQSGGLTFLYEVESPGDAWGLVLGPGIRNPTVEELESRLSSQQRRAATWFAGGDMDSLEPRRAEDPQQLGEGARWVALEDRYFITAVIPSGARGAVQALPVANLDESDGSLRGFTLLEAGDVTTEDLTRDLMLVLEASGGQLAGRAYFGDKQYDALAAMRVRLEKTVRYGFFGVISRPLQFGLRWIYDNIVANYGWSIVLMTVLIRLVLFPLTHKSQVSMQRIQKLNPRMEAIRAKYRPKLKDGKGRPRMDQQRKMNEEIQALFREEGVNPASGCLPILFQMPVFFGFFRLLSEAVELWDAAWLGWIGNLALPDPIYVLPLVMGASQFLQQRMLPPPANRTQKLIINTMPIWFTIFSFSFPSGLVLYWLTNNILGIVQTGVYNQLKKRGYLGGEPAVQATETKKK
ncbi:MAG: membrane protein insertase YidC [Acidobacteriota bacterium]|nr:membrane protein insertase YidC [Acidobacteriota bacterium]MDE2921949.1 membrane protein insertase YidC [Acidobacteriota bacterium]MDE3265959.1 membrane protein insertase YidC [Acidobacteriota bacterium]